MHDMNGQESIITDKYVWALTHEKWGSRIIDKGTATSDRFNQKYRLLLIKHKTLRFPSLWKESHLNICFTLTLIWRILSEYPPKQLDQQYFDDRWKHLNMLKDIIVNKPKVRRHKRGRIVAVRQRPSVSLDEVDNILTISLTLILSPFLNWRWISLLAIESSPKKNGWVSTVIWMVSWRGI